MAGPFDPWRNNYDIPGPQDPRRRDEIRPSVAPRWEELLPGSTVTAINQNPVAQALGRFLSKPSTGIGEVTRVSRIDGRPVPPEPGVLDKLPATVQEGIGGAMLLGQFLAPSAKPILNPTTGKFARGADPIKRGFRERSPEYPGIYKDPREIAADAAALTAPEDPAMRRLFGVTRDDLYGIAEGGRRPGNVPGEDFVKWAPNARGSTSAEGIMTDKNAGRILDVLVETEKAAPELTKGMKSWYTMDPAYKRLVDLVGPDAAKMHYERFNTLTGMSSPGSEVLTELNRGTAANWLASQGRFSDFVKYGGKASSNGVPVAGAPADMVGILGHPYHKTSQALPMSQYLETGKPQLGAPKVASYIPASGVPETGFQTNVPVGDAHFSRAIGLADTRKGPTDIGASISTPELQTMLPWFREKISGAYGLEPVPTQATMWGAFAPQTGVTTPIGAPKLELFSQQIMKAANRMGVSPEVARDMILTGRAHAGSLAGPAIGLGALGAMMDETEPPL